MTIAVFLDRDGTINEEIGYIRNVADLRLIPGAAEAVRLLNDAGILTVLTTNQTGPARGFYGEDHVVALNLRLAELLDAEAGARLDAVYYCPHLEKGVVPEFAVACECRKPRQGMIQSAMARFKDITLSECYVIGDKASDVEFGANAGCHSVLLKTGYGQRVLDGKYQVLAVTPTMVCDNLLEAAKQILERTQATAASV